MTTLASIAHEADRLSAPQLSRSTRAIHRASFGVADRGDNWSWSASATWWHQVRGVKGFHKRILFGMMSKSEYMTPPTVEDIAVIYNESSNYIWEVSS